MKTSLPFFFIALVISLGKTHSQDAIDKTLRTWNKESVPYIYPDNLPMPDSILYLDTREQEEYDVSHLKNAMWVGYKAFDATKFTQEVPNKTQPIIVYCSVGVRSENIGEQLKDLGYTKVLNLYGGIFKWKNMDRQVYNTLGNPTDSIHAFSKHWGKLLEKGVKVY